MTNGVDPARPALWLWIVTTFVQHAGAGAVTAAVVNQSWLVLLVAVYTMQTLWWFNMGQRIDRHGRFWDGQLYCVVSALGWLAGAWWWR